MADIALDVRTYPLDNPKGSTLAFASVSLNVDGVDLVAINGVRVVNGEKGLFVTMPQSQSKDGDYHDIAFPLNGDLRKEMNKAVLAEYDKSVSADRKQSLSGKLNIGKQKAAEYAAQPRAAAMAKSRAPGRD